MYQSDMLNGHPRNEIDVAAALLWCFSGCVVCQIHIVHRQLRIPCLLGQLHHSLVAFALILEVSQPVLEGANQKPLMQPTDAANPGSLWLLSAVLLWLQQVHFPSNCCGFENQ